MEDFGSFLEDIRAKQEALMAHRAECTTRPCAVCGIFECPRCRGPMPGRGAVYNYRTWTHGYPREARDETRSGVCQGCANADIRQSDLELARRSIPRHFRWAKLAAPELAARVQDANGLSIARAAARSRSVLIRGASGTGKTSLAVAMLYLHLDAATLETAPDDVVERAKGIRFVSTYTLAQAHRDHPLGKGEAPMVTEAKRATLLLLDDLGAEKDPTVAQEVIQWRHDHEVPLWTTTFLTNEQIAARYGGGAERRLTEKTRVIELTKPAQQLRVVG